jgi:hypothetical protein
MSPRQNKMADSASRVQGPVPVTVISEPEEADGELGPPVRMDSIVINDSDNNDNNDRSARGLRWITNNDQRRRGHKGVWGVQ